MIVVRIVGVDSFADEPDEEVSIDTFVVMQWNEIQIVETQNGCDEENSSHTKLPDALRNVLFECAKRPARIVNLRGMRLYACLCRTRALVATWFCRVCSHQLPQPSQTGSRNSR